MKAYKGFEKGLICRGKQYAENTVFEEDNAVVCELGMHYCKNPFEVMNYYSLIGNNGELNDFAEVEPLAEELTDDGKKFCTKKLKVGVKLSLAGFVKACVNFLKEETNAKNTSGDGSQVATSGDGSQVATSGNCSKIATSGNYSQVATSGNYSQVATSGDCSQIATSGNCSKIATSGNYSQVATSGNYSQVATSGNCSQIATSGDYSKIATSGDDSQVATSGDGSVVCCIGIKSKASAKIGSWIILSEWCYSKEKERYIPKCVKTEYVDGVKIKEDTFYILENGEFKESQ